MDSFRNLHNRLKTLTPSERQAQLLHLADDSPQHIQLSFLEWEEIAKLLDKFGDIDTLIALARHRLNYFGDNDADESGRSARIQASIQLHKIRNLNHQHWVALSVPYMQFPEPHDTIERLQRATRALYEMRNRWHPDGLGIQRQNQDDDLHDPCVGCGVRGKKTTCRSCRYTIGEFSFRPFLDVPEIAVWASWLVHVPQTNSEAMMGVLRHFDRYFSRYGHLTHHLDRYE